LFDSPSRPCPSSHSSDSTENREEPKFLFEICLIVANIRPRLAKGNGALELPHASVAGAQMAPLAGELKIHETYASLQ
jgi:hypothetical protein